MSSSSRKIQATKNYRLFARSEENRPLNTAKHKRLYESMKLYGFLPCFPIVCVRDDKGNLIVKDGQHRLQFAETLGLTVYWVEEKVDFDVALINCTGKTWALKDYAQKFAANGIKDYQEAIEFSEQHGIHMGTAAALLSGTTTYGNIQGAFVSGQFKVKDRVWANSVAGLFAPMSILSDNLKNSRFLEACMAVCRVANFDPKRMLANAERCREKLLSYSTKEAYLDMLEQVYNFGRKQLVGLKASATMVMRERNAINKSIAQKKAKGIDKDAA